ncbi:hypothetical protein [Tessaracoccus antarcticus]|uniref:hypothetical protein n=1 Tax=Tessaracoccus antarcticus TaxID=2479848 RepID=UPI001F2B8275|nr:hypothetical protein [Tessaracoccus antarcticus]
MTAPSLTPPATRTGTQGTRTPVGRVLLLGVGGLCLLAGLDAALVRLGVWAPVASERVGDLHGPVMVLGFLGTLISLERAQALRNPLAHVAPALLGVGAVVLVAGGPVLLGQLLLFDGALAFTAVLVALWVRAPVPLVAAQALGAFFAALAAGLWMRLDVATILPLLAVFLIITIASERAELAQLTMGARAVPTLLTLVCLLSLGAITAVVAPAVGLRILGLGATLVAFWLLRDDVGRRMVRTSGLRRFNAAALMAGNVWLALAGLVWLVVGQPDGRWAYDIVIHGTFLGFGISMVMAHAPIIFPAVIGRPLPYTRAFWVPLVALHASLALRVVGDLAGIDLLWRTGGIVNVASILLFILVAAHAVIRP